MLASREQYDEFLNGWLVPYAVKAPADQARKHPQHEHDYRSEFQRDRDRIIHCSAFRRLDFKTQVFVPHQQDHFRTRLTHTIEVAQISRTLARALRLNEDLCEAVALAHDLGHPPFGHGGEQALDELMTGLGQFEHNRQSLRVVDYLEHPYPDFRGLNLTRAVRECIAKHQTRYDNPVCEDFDTSLQAPLEGQIVDLADEIAYTSADLEDSLACGVINQQQLENLGLWNQAYRIAENDSPNARDIHKRIRATKAVLDILAGDLLETTTENLARLNPPNTDAVRRAGTKLAHFSPSVSTKLEQLQKFLLDNVYLGPLNLKHDKIAKQTIRDLFNKFISEPTLMPSRYQKRITADSLHRVTCDYIAGMTDRFCKQEHEKLFSRQ